MHEMFSTWVSSLMAGGEGNDSQVVAWSEACESLVAEAQPMDLVGLNRAAWGRPTGEFDVRWRRHLQEYDQLFQLRGGDHKAATLAAAAMLVASETDTKSGFALILRRCASAIDWTPSINELPLSRPALVGAAADLRVVPDWPTRSTFKVASSGADALINEAIQNGTGVTPELLKVVVQRVTQQAGEAVTRAHAKIRTLLEGREAPMREQTEILIWLMSGTSELLDSPWDAMSPLTAALTAACEINNLSLFSLGRPDAEGLIDAKVQSAAKKEKITDKDIEGLGALLPSNAGVEDITPLISDLSTAGDAEPEPYLVGLRLHDELNLARFVLHSERRTE